jgi:hypothetical protein
MTPQDQKTVDMAMGRIFGMMTRPTQDGDLQEYQRCRNLILDLTEGTIDTSDRSPCYIRDRNKGAQGD